MRRPTSSRSGAPPPTRASLTGSRTTTTRSELTGSGARQRSHASYGDHSSAMTPAPPKIGTPVATRAAAAPISAASAAVFIGGRGLGAGRRGGGLAGGLELLKQPLGVFVGRRLQEADGARHVLRHAEPRRVASRERDARPGLAFVGGRLEVVQDP